jgi:hypothetical protein
MATTIAQPKLDEASFVTIEVTCDAAAVEVEVGFNPRKVEVVAEETGYMAICVNGAAKAIKLAATGSAINNPITFGTNNKITLGVEASLNVSGKKTLLLCYK